MPDTIDFAPCSVDASPATLAPRRTECREQLRSLSHRLLVVRYRRDAEAVSESARIWNLSTEGIGLLLGHAIPVGATVHLQFRHRAVEDRGAGVLNAVAEGAAWIINCRLDRLLSPHKLRALLT